MNELRNILPTLILKLAKTFPPFRSIVADHLRSDPNLTSKSMKDSIFLDFICNLPHHPKHALVFVIDALDECGDAQNRPVLLKVLTEAVSHAPWLKIIVTSRPEEEIQHFFYCLPRSSNSRYDLATDLKKPELICKPSPEASSIWWPKRGVYPPLGQNNRSLTK